MFTGLIQALGTVVQKTSRGQGAQLGVDISGLRAKPSIGASIAINGVCLTVTSLASDVAYFDAVEETMHRTNLGGLTTGDRVNLEPALVAGCPLDGHFVLGHVDATSKILAIEPRGGSQRWRFSIPHTLTSLIAEKGSIAVDGISLTVTEADLSSFCISIIPHTLQETTLSFRSKGDIVNLEADVIARYLNRREAVAQAGVSMNLLRDNGFA